MPDAQSLRDPRLDGVRGLAILLVLLFHTLQYPLVRTPGGVALTALPALGWSGVDLFFVLSGYLITNILLETRSSQSYARTFYARRVLRIFPLYYAVLTFLLALAPRIPPLAGLEQAWNAGQHASGAWYWLFLSNVLAARDGGFDRMALAITWSLAIEEQFYLFWPWVVRRLSERRLLGLCGALVVLALVLRTALAASGASWIVSYVLTPCRIDTLATGAAIAIVARRPGALAQLAVPARRALLAAGGLLAVVVVSLRIQHRYALPTLHSVSLNADPLMQTLGYTILCVLWGALLVTILTASPGSRLARIFELGALRNLGAYSYGLYLLHQIPTIWLSRIFPPAPLVRHFVIAQCVYSAIAIGLAYALARLSWVALESPCLALKRYVPYRR